MIIVKLLASMVAVGFFSLAGLLAFGMVGVALSEIWGWK